MLTKIYNFLNSLYERIGKLICSIRTPKSVVTILIEQQEELITSEDDIELTETKETENFMQEEPELNKIEWKDINDENVEENEVDYEEEPNYEEDEEEEDEEEEDEEEEEEDNDHSSDEDYVYEEDHDDDEDDESDDDDEE